MLSYRTNSHFVQNSTLKKTKLAFVCSLIYLGTQKECQDKSNCTPFVPSHFQLQISNLANILHTAFHAV